MAITVTCGNCGATTEVSDKYAGLKGQCRTCKTAVIVGQPLVYPSDSAKPALPVSPSPPVRDYTKPTSERIPPATSPELATSRNPPADQLFDRNIFLLRQNHLAINEKYAVWDEEGTAILFVERPAHLLRNILALVGGLMAGGAIFTIQGVTYQMLPDSLQSVYILVGALLAFVVIIAVYVRLEMKRHVEFYRDETKKSKVLRVIQDKKLELLSANYTVTDAADKIIGTFRKNYLYNIIRKQWECRDRNGTLQFIVREDSIIKSLLRRLFGPLFGLLRQNFIFCDPESGVVIGEFNRSFTILDRYVLNMSQDIGGCVERRLALAMGVMLDTGERR